MFDSAERFGVSEVRLLASAERLEVAVVGAGRGHSGVGERGVEVFGAFAGAAAAAFAGGLVVPGALAAPDARRPAVGNTRMSTPISAISTSAVRWATPGFVHKSSARLAKGRNCSSIASEAARSARRGSRDG